MIADKLQHRDEHWDVQAQERRAAQEIDRQIREISLAVSLADRMIALEAAPGYEAFQKAVGDMKTFRQRELETCQGSDSEVRILQGRCRQLGEILALLKNARKNRETLAERVKLLQDQKLTLIRPDGKVQPTGVS